MRYKYFNIATTCVKRRKERVFTNPNYRTNYSYFLDFIHEVDQGELVRCKFVERKGKNKNKRAKGKDLTRLTPSDPDHRVLPSPSSTKPAALAGHRDSPGLSVSGIPVSESTVHLDAGVGVRRLPCSSSSTASFFGGNNVSSIGFRIRIRHSSLQQKKEAFLSPNRKTNCNSTPSPGNYSAKRASLKLSPVWYFRLKLL